MKEFEDLMSVWAGQPQRDTLSVDEMLKQVKKGIKDITNQLYWAIVAMVSVSVLSFIVLFFLRFQSPLTYMGIVIMMLTMLMYAIMVIRNYRILNKRDATLYPTEYLKDIKQYQRNRAKTTGWFYYLYVLLISVGLSLYFVEILQNSTVVYRFSVYALSVLWLVFLTFYYKKRIFRNEEEKLNLVIDRLERLRNQFE